MDAGQDLFAVFDGEGLALRFAGEPFSKARAEAAPFRIEIRLLPGIGRGKGGEDGVDGRLELARKLICIDSGDKFRLAVNGLEYAFQNGVQQLTRLRGIEAPLDGVEGLSGETFDGEGLKGAGRLAAEDVGTAGVLLAGPGGRGGTVGNGLEKRCGGRFGIGRGSELQGCAAGEKAGDEGRRTELLVLLALGIAEDDAGGAGQEARGYDVGEVPVGLGCGVRHRETALDGRREEWVKAAALRPGQVVRAEEPDSVELLAGGLEGAHDLDGRVVGLGREDGVAGVAFELREEIRVRAERSVKVEESKIVEQPLPALEGLKLNRVGCARAGPDCGFEQAGNEVGPEGGRARLVEDFIGSDGAEQSAEMVVHGAEVRVGCETGVVVGQGTLGAEKGGAGFGETTLFGVVAGDSESIGNRAGDESGEQEPGNFRLREGMGEPAQQQAGGADDGNAGEGLAEGELPGHPDRRIADVVARGHEDATKGTIDGAAEFVDAESDDADADGGILGEEAAGPPGTGGDFIAHVRCSDPPPVRIVQGGGEFTHDEAAGCKGGEELALRRSDAVKSDEADFCGEHDACIRGEIFRELAEADPVLAGAFAFEGGGPLAEALGVGLLTGGPRGAARGVSVEGGEQGPGIHGEGSHGFRGDDQGGVGALDAGPHCALLQGREQHGRIGMSEGVAPP